MKCRLYLDLLNEIVRDAFGKSAWNIYVEGKLKNELGFTPSEKRLWHENLKRSD